MKEHSQSEEHQGRDLSGHAKKEWSKADSLPGDHRGRDLSGARKKVTKQGRLTNWRPQKEGLVRTQKESDQARQTHCLETTEGGTCQNTERK